jgi:uncharacterized protein (DUF488 family)
MALFSIGHSNASLAAFIELLRCHAVTVLVDTRSQPYSRYNPQFSREALKQALNAADIIYVFLGNELGGRPADPLYYYQNGKVDYELLATAKFYQAGIERLLALAAEEPVAFMCSEADYKKCHRYWLITRTLVERGVAVKHILPAGETVDSTADEFEPAQPSLF